mmetsp:Transcript_75708/g.239381  ORF Transcript_75708/g.239381 Transcript_75708/m.239381 type:complete len:98 (-) Transcript_75708:522-815(-)
MSAPVRAAAAATACWSGRLQLWPCGNLLGAFPQGGAPVPRGARVLRRDVLAEGPRWALGGGSEDTRGAGASLCLWPRRGLASRRGSLLLFRAALISA